MKKAKGHLTQLPALDLAQIEKRLKQLDAAGWYSELMDIYKLSVMHDLGLHTSHPTIHNIPHGDDIIVGDTPWPVVQLFEPRDRDRVIHKGTRISSDEVLLEDRVISKDAPFEIPRERLPVLVVGLDAPDAVILDMLKRELKKARKRYPAPASIVKPGRPALNSRFDETMFKQWRRAKIVPLAKLLAWKSTLTAEGKRNWPEHRLGEEIGLDPKGVSEAKVLLRRALASLPSLCSQIASHPELLPLIDEYVEDDERRC